MQGHWGKLPDSNTHMSCCRIELYITVIIIIINITITIMIGYYYYLMSLLIASASVSARACAAPQLRSLFVVVVVFAGDHLTNTVVTATKSTTNTRGGIDWFDAFNLITFSARSCWLLFVCYTFLFVVEQKKNKFRLLRASVESRWGVFFCLRFLEQQVFFSLIWLRRSKPWHDTIRRAFLLFRQVVCIIIYNWYTLSGVPPPLNVPWNINIAWMSSGDNMGTPVGWQSMWKLRATFSVDCRILTQVAEFASYHRYSWFPQNFAEFCTG